MPAPRELLLIDAGERPLQDLAARLKRLGYRMVAVKTPGGAREVLSDPRRKVGAAILPPDLAVVDLRTAIDSWRGMSSDAEITFLAAGIRPDASACEALRQAGVRFGLWEPLDPHTLQFLVNHALASDEAIARERRTLRVPVDWRIQVRTAQREKEARLYSLSANGAFLATERPLMRRALVHLTLPLPTGPVQTTGRVVMTNVPGNLMHRNLPVGMGVVFTGTAVEAEASLQIFAEERYRELDPLASPRQASAACPTLPAMSDEILRYEQEGDVALLRMDDGRANAISHAMLKGLHAGLDRAEKEARAVVLLGRPGRFSAGFDLAVMSAGPEAAQELVKSGAQLLLRFYELPLPLVAACSGHALAMGSLLLLASDARIGVRGEFKIGLNEVAIRMTLPVFAVELARARLSTLHFQRATSQAEIYDPEGALEAGYLDALVEAADLAEASLAEAARLAELPRRAFAETKVRARRETLRFVRETLDADIKSFGAGS